MSTNSANSSSCRPGHPLTVRRGPDQRRLPSQTEHPPTRSQEAARRKNLDLGADLFGDGSPAEGLRRFPSLLFPKDRTVLRVPEVAGRLRVTNQHVIGLIEEGKLRALNVAGSNTIGRRCYRIPVEAWEAYVRDNFL